MTCLPGFKLEKITVTIIFSLCLERLSERQILHIIFVKIVIDCFDTEVIEEAI